MSIMQSIQKIDSDFFLAVAISKHWKQTRRKTCYFYLHFAKIKLQFHFASPGFFEILIVCTFLKVYFCMCFRFVFCTIVCELYIHLNSYYTCCHLARWLIQILFILTVLQPCSLNICNRLTVVYMLTYRRLLTSVPHLRLSNVYLPCLY